MRCLLIVALLLSTLASNAQTKRSVFLSYSNIFDLVDTRLRVENEKVFVEYLVVNEDTLITSEKIDERYLTLKSGRKLHEIIDEAFNNGLISDAECGNGISDFNESLSIEEWWSDVYPSREVSYLNRYNKCSFSGNMSIYNLRAVVYKIKESVE